MFHVGQKVVCVDDAPRVTVNRRTWFGFTRPELLDHNLNRDDVYQIVQLHSCLCKTSGKVFTMLLLAEAKHFTMPQLGFPSFQFRPLIEKKTDISIFTAMLPPVKIKTPERV